MKRADLHFHGNILPMVTPFDAREEVDGAALSRYVNWLIEQGVHALYACSGCGEVWKLSPAEKRQVIDLTVQAAAGRAPVLIGTGEGSTRETIALTAYAKKAGADAAVIWPPYMAGPSYGDESVVEHFQAVSDATGFPIFVYDAPEMCGYSLAADLVARLAEIDHVVGLKDSSGNMMKFLRQIQLCGDKIDIFQGCDALLFPSLLAGAKGGFSSRANIAPRFVFELFEDFRAGRVDEAQRRGDVLTSVVFSPLIRRDLWQLMKGGLNLQGIAVGGVRRPHFAPPFGLEALAELKAALKAMGVTPRVAVA